MSPRVPDLSVVILTLNEEANLPAALAAVTGWCAEVLILDSGSTDRTLDVAREYKAKVFHRDFDDYSSQRRHALRELPFSTPWLFILDADEYPTGELKDEIARVLPTTDKDAFFIKRRFHFMGRWIRRGYYPTWLLRLGRCDCLDLDGRAVNEHYVCTTGRTGRLEHDFVDENRKGLSEWVAKHNRYSTLEARALLEDAPGGGRLWGSQRERTTWLVRNAWRRMPPLVRPVLYFLYRYVLRGGFLDGRQALVYHLLHALVFRTIVDCKYLEMKWKERGSVSYSKDGPSPR